MHPWHRNNKFRIFVLLCFGKDTPYNPFLLALKLHEASHLTEFHHN